MQFIVNEAGSPFVVIPLGKIGRAAVRGVEFVVPDKGISVRGFDLVGVLCYGYIGRFISSVDSQL